MANIKILDDNTINQIAAGEVVERPVSVVKELVENAIDAGSTNISVEIKDGGISLIRVTDNGSGIDRDSIRTAFLRHATSKITSITDLLNVKSLGFRGEALSSIAAVSQIELLTKVKDDFTGIRYCLNGSKEYSFDDVGIPDGTTIIVRNLFFNTPARRKFLKSAVTEGNYITELMERLVLSHPEIGFRYISNGKEKIASSGNGDIKENIYSIFGRDIARQIMPVSFESDGLSIKGYVGKPEIARGNRNFELFFVNDRFVKSPVLSKAVEEAYKSYLMLHKYPFVILYFDIALEDLDVNVHPAKTEIRFLRETDLYTRLSLTVENALKQKELIPEVTQSGLSQKVISNTIIEPAVIAAEPTKCETVKAVDTKAQNIKADANTNTVPAAQSVPPIDVKRAPEPFETDKINEYKTAAIEKNDSPEMVIKAEQLDLFGEGFISSKNVIRHKIIGQVFDTYWIVELDNKMFIIDQHAAHEKVLYERFKKRIEEDDVFVQSLSPAVIITLTNSEIEVFNRFESNFRKLGFDIEHFGGKDYAITGVPTDLFGLSEKDYFLAVLDDLHQNPKITDNAAVNDRIATMACKAAIKGNMRFSYSEAKALIDELLLLDNPYNCPHGRPTIISYSKQEMEKLFKRIV